MGLNGPPDRHSVIAQPTIRPVVLLLIVALHSAACSSSGPATTSLFAINESRLSKSDQEAITRIFESFSDDSSCGELTPEAEVVDLNADGVQEVFVQWGNACTSGLTGRSLSLFIKDSSGS